MKYKLILVALMFPLIAFAQKTKTQSQQNPPTPAELEKLLKQAQTNLNNLTPEQKKMMQQLGIQLPDLSQIPVNGSSFQSGLNALELPIKDDARIAVASRYTVVPNQISAYLGEVRNSIFKNYSPQEIKQCEEAFMAIVKKIGPNENRIGNAAIYLWTLQQYKASLYLLLNLNATTTIDDNVLNNTAAFLSMTGNEEWAIPLLNYLNKKYPNNSTILNNLGQAWVGLGDLIQAEKYLKNATALYPHHPKANFTQALIEEKKGNNLRAIELIKKAVHLVYNEAMDNKLRKLNYKLKPGDIGFSKKYKPDSDPLGLHQFAVPDIPKSYEELVGSENLWKAFHADILAKVQELSQRRNQLMIPLQEKFNKNVESYLNQNTKTVDGKERKNSFSRQAKIMLDAMYQDGGIDFRLKASKKAYEDFVKKELKQWMASYQLELMKIEQKSIGISNNTKQEGGEKSETLCQERMALITKYLRIVAPKLEEYHNAYINQLKIMMNEEVFWKQFEKSTIDFEKLKLDYQIQFLSALNVYLPSEFNKIDYCKIEDGGGGRYKLAEFKDIYCAKNDTVNLGYGQFEYTCNTVTSKLGIDFLGLKIFEIEVKQDYNQVKNWNQEWWEVAAESIVNCTIEAGPSKGFDETFGPLKMEAEIEGALIIEIGKSGITDIGLKTSLEAGIKLEPHKQTNEAGFTFIGVESKFTVNSGFSVESKGLLARINKKMHPVQIP
ncbi:MAG: hypothetical protein RLY16_980 [Bacteroidota bacterium]